MATPITLSPFLVLTFSTFCLTIAASSDQDHARQTHIVYMGELREHDTIALADMHHSLLSEAIGDEMIARKSLVHSYGKSFNAFAAKLLPCEAESLSKKEGVVSVFPSKMQQLLTTRSWDFLGMPQNIKRNQQKETNIIVGLLDTGVWIESPSFSDKGFGPPPKKWKGACASGSNFTGCNNKVIGALYFDLGGAAQPEKCSPVDVDGHGSHTASTVAGVAVESASLYGIAEGTARGGVPSARIASYKVCWDIGCDDIDILGGFDTAIEDGVDIISVSIGGDNRPFNQDPIAIGSFHAAEKGILTVCAAGNGGPMLSTVQNIAPWIVTVAASTIDRKFLTDVKLGNGKTIPGIAINTFAPKEGFYPLTSGALAGNDSADIFGNRSACDPETLSPEKVKGKIVYCQGRGGDTVVHDLGGVGTIMSNDENVDTAFPTVEPGTFVSLADGEAIEKYINSTKSPQAIIYKTEVVNATGPAIASFSSRGPHFFTRHILKPDIAAPGVNILAAYTKFGTLTGDDGDKRVVQYNIESGTSMACPHVSGAAAYVKSFHPHWSPAAIRSALMTTSKRMKIKAEEAELASGSGEINPKEAVNPGLIYDIDTKDYIRYLCKIGYDSGVISKMMEGNNCSTIPNARGADGLNYPSILLEVNTTTRVFAAVFEREVTNVGEAKSVYRAEVKTPKGMMIVVTPNVLRFEKTEQKKSFKVTVKGKLVKKKWYLSGSLSWTNARHNVRSPVLVYFQDI